MGGTCKRQNFAGSEFAMLSQQLAPLFSTTARTARCASRRLPVWRSLSSTSSLSNATVDTPESKAPAFDDFGEPDEPGKPTTYAEFLDQVAWKYRCAEPQNWLSNTVSSQCLLLSPKF